MESDRRKVSDKEKGSEGDGESKSIEEEGGRRRSRNIEGAIYSQRTETFFRSWITR